MSQALYRKWRPRQWDQVIGQDHLIQTLHNAVKSGRVGHAYLFAGPRGTGKTTTARLLAKAVNCLDEDLGNRPCDQCAHCMAVNENRFLDLIEIDAASNTSVEDVRDLRDKINFSPSQGLFKVYIIDEIHMLSTAAFNALLKTLEEPPAARHFHPGDNRNSQDSGHGAFALPALRVPARAGGLDRGTVARKGQGREPGGG